MLKRTIKRILISCGSVLGISLLIWTLALLNPGFSYAHETKIDNVTIHHDQKLETATEAIIINALEIIKQSALYDSSIDLQLCLNDGSSYPNYHPLSSGLAYSFFNKSVIYRSTPNFKENIAQAEWPENNFEKRQFNLTWLIAHEFMHGLQFNHNLWLQFNIGLWKLEGHAEYISRTWKGDNLLKEKVKELIKQEQLPHNGLPVFELEDGTKQILSYYKYGLLTQFLMEEEGLTFDEFIKDERSIEEIYASLLRMVQ